MSKLNPFCLHFPKFQDYVFKAFFRNPLYSYCDVPLFISNFILPLSLSLLVIFVNLFVLSSHELFVALFLCTVPLISVSLTYLVF